MPKTYKFGRICTITKPMRTLLFILLSVTATANPPMWIVREEIIQQGVEHPDLVFSQYLLETGFGRFIHLDNIFGFKAKKHLDFTTSPGRWRDCVSFYKKWYEGAKKRSKRTSFVGVIISQWKAPGMVGYLKKVIWIYKHKVKNEKTSKKIYFPRRTI